METASNTAQMCLLRAFLWDKKKPWKHMLQEIKIKKQEQMKRSGNEMSVIPVSPRASS